MKMVVFFQLLFSSLIPTSPAQAESVVYESSHGGAIVREQREARIRSGISDQEPWLGLVGDSGITGAATSADLHATAWSLGRLVTQFLWESTRSVQQADIKRIPNPERFGLKGPQVDPLVRVLYSMSEFYEAKKDGKLVDLNGGAKGSLRLDIPEYSYGYLAGRALGFPASRIVLVAQDGQRVDSIYKQLMRFGEVSKSLPSHVLISYSANDICGDELDGSLEEFSRNFKKTLERELKLSLLNMNPHPRLGTRIIVMAPLDVPQILTNKDLLEQKIYFAGAGQKTCGDVRYGRAAEGKVGEEMQKTLVSMCRSVFRTSPDDIARVERIAEFQKAQIQAWKEVVAGLHQPGWSFEVNESSRRPIFRTGDLAHDCFHPGPGAHAALATQLIRSLGTDFIRESLPSQ